MDGDEDASSHTREVTDASTQDGGDISLIKEPPSKGLYSGSAALASKHSSSKDSIMEQSDN